MAGDNMYSIVNHMKIKFVFILLLMACLSTRYLNTFPYHDCTSAGESYGRRCLATIQTEVGVNIALSSIILMLTWFTLFSTTGKHDWRIIVVLYILSIIITSDLVNGIVWHKDYIDETLQLEPL